MRHCIYTRMNFDDFHLMNKYLKITNDVLVPALKSQTCKNFEWVLIINPNHEEHLRLELDYEFITIYNTKDVDISKTNSEGTPIHWFSSVRSHAIDNNINIQTRHDCDDWISNDYVEKIQMKYNEYIDKYTTFLIQSQPIRKVYNTGKEYSLRKYTKDGMSMHLSLCQKEIKHHIYEHGHGHMGKISKNLITLDGVCTKWIIHGNNISVGRPDGKHLLK